MRRVLVLAMVWPVLAFAGDESPPPPTASSPAPPTAQPPPAPPGPATTPPPLHPPAGPVLAEIDIDALPDACRELGTLAGSHSLNQALSARIALATCLVDDKSKALVLCDCEQSVIEVNEILDPSLALLDEVFANGTPALQILARHAEGQLLASFTTRLLNAVPPPVDATPEALALRQTRLAMLQPLVEPWLRRAHIAFTEIDRIARERPALENNPAVVAAVRDSRARLTPGLPQR